MALLLNGCSYGVAWTNFPGINLSQNGSSFYRCVRTTVEYCASHGNPDAVLIPITFMDRDEYITQDGADIEIEGPYNKSNTSEELRELNIAFKMLHPNDYATYDKLFKELTLFAGWLDSQQIPYLIWDQCNRFDRQHIRGFRAINKLKYIEENKRIIDLFKFCANSYMYEYGAEFNDPAANHPSNAHYSYEEYSEILVPFLNNYIQKYDLGIEGLDRIISEEELQQKKEAAENPTIHNWLKPESKEIL